MTTQEFESIMNDIEKMLDSCTTKQHYQGQTFQPATIDPMFRTALVGYKKIMMDKLSEEKPTFLYGAREVATGKQVSNITNPRRKYWDKKGNAVNAIEYHNRKDPRWRKSHEPGPVELITFVLSEVKDENINSN